MPETIAASSTQLEVYTWDALTPFLEFIFGADGMIGGVTIFQTYEVFGIIWSVFTVLAYIASFIFLVLYVYASIHYNELDDQVMENMHAAEEAYARERMGGATPNRFADMKAHLESENPNDWKLAIIEADIILDESLKRQGYAGTSLGERLRSVSPQSLQSIDDAWEAHKIRNEIAHSGADFVLTHKLARETIMRYERVFTEMGLMTE